MRAELKASSPAGYAVDLSPKGEVQRGLVAKRHLSLWGRGRRKAAGEGAFVVALALSALPASAANLVLPHTSYGNAEGCAYLASGDVDTDALQFLEPDQLGTYGSQCSFTDVSATSEGLQRADAVCGHEGEEFFSTEEFVVLAGMPNGPVTVYTGSGELWGKLEPCL